MSGAQIPTNLLPYDSYAIDPKWQRKFTIVWTSVLAFSLLLAIPSMVRAVKRGRAWTSVLGIKEEWDHTPYTPANASNRKRQGRRIGSWFNPIFSMGLWSIPYSGVNITFVTLIVAYIVTVLVCITHDADLSYNANRAGFIAVSQLPPLFLLASKNTPLSLLLSPVFSYTSLNALHRWAGRTLFLSAAIHGSLWMTQHRQYNLPILGPQKETSGVAALSVLCILVLSSLRVVRRLFWEGFWVVHVLGYVSFFVIVCNHTPYARPWIFPAIAVYGLDILMRMVRMRVKDATLIAVGDEMTLITVHDCNKGWHAGQHVRLRVFFNGRIFESHPLTIMNAPSSPDSRSEGCINLGASVAGDWTRSLNQYAKSSVSEKNTAGVPVQVMVDGPYGGPSIQLGDYENVLLVSGGSGATFALGLLDDLIQRRDAVRRIEFVWFVRSSECIAWFARVLRDLAERAKDAGLDLHISIYITRTDPGLDVVEDLGVQNCIVRRQKPDSRTLLQTFVTPASSSCEEGLERASLSLAGGLGVCASGPESLTREVGNAVAWMSLPGHILSRVDVGVHTEVYAL